MTNYSRSPSRSFAGTISDRYADGLETVLVIGDVTSDIDEFYVHVKDRDGYRVLRKTHENKRFGCAAAVAAMVEGLGCRAMGPGYSTPIIKAWSPNEMSVKRRMILDDRVLCRVDEEKLGTPPADLPPAALVLIADYAKGAVTPELMDRIAEKYKGKEIIADWHPSRPREFYHCATALKASWNCPPASVPTIITFGERGMCFRPPWETAVLTQNYFPARELNPLDPCGAGDMVLATLGAGRMLGLDWQECCEWASDNAAAVCRQWGSVAVPSDYKRWRLGKWQGEANELPAMG